MDLIETILVNKLCLDTKKTRRLIKMRSQQQTSQTIGYDRRQRKQCATNEDDVIN